MTKKNNFKIYKGFILLMALFFLACKSSKINTTKGNKNSTQTYPAKKTTSKKTETKVATKSNTNSSSGTESNTKPTEILVATSKVKATTNDIKKYISDFKDITKNNMKLHGIPASISMAQGILESGAGFGTLAKNANNHFGIKCHNDWKGESVRHDDDTLQECFRKYNEAADSYKDHSSFLKRKRYDALFKLDKGDYTAWAKGLKAAGYATDPLYPDKLIGLIERFELYELDNEVLSRNFKPIPKEKPTINDVPKEIIKPEVSEYMVQKGDTLYNVSKRFNVSVSDIILWNNLVDNQISIGQRIRVK